MPRVQVFVSLAEARSVFEELLGVALTETVPLFRRLVQAEIQDYDFAVETGLRQGDPKRRGPG